MLGGQVPTSNQILKYSADITADSAIVSRQIDYLAAKTISAYNLFSAEIAKESNFLEKINSKVKVLQLYSKSFSDDVYYYGDSFDNLEKVDTTVTYARPLADVVNGSLSLPVVAGSKWSADSVFIQEKDQNNNVTSNGILGNSHMAYFNGIQTSTNLPETASEYKYVFERTPSFSVVGALRDDSPNTYFEYEKFNISNLNGADFDYEFKHRNIINNQNVFVPWSTNDNSPLVMELVLEKRSPYIANSIKVTPFFGHEESAVQSVLLKEVNVYTTDQSFPQVENVLHKPIYIGSSVVPAADVDVNNYFFKDANINFSERRVSKISLKFEQSQSIGVTVKHFYWDVSSVRTSYQFQTNDVIALNRQNINLTTAVSLIPNTRSSWSANARFNPNLIYADPKVSEVSGIETAVSKLMNPIANTVFNQLSTNFTQSTSIVAKKEVTYDYYVMKVLDKRSGTTANPVYKYLEIPDARSGGIGFQTIGSQPITPSAGATPVSEWAHELSLAPSGATPFSTWWPATHKLYGSTSVTDETKKFLSSTDIDDPVIGQRLLPYAATPNYALIAATPYQNFGITEDAFDWWMTRYKLTGIHKQDYYKGTATPAYYLGDYTVLDSEIASEKRQVVANPNFIYNINLNKKYEILKDGEIYNGQRLNVRRWSIGLRDIRVQSNSYQTNAEVISKPFNFPYPIEFLMLNSDYFIPDEYISQQTNQGENYLSYYISIDNGGEWLPISPVEDPFNQSIPEIYAFGQNASAETRIPGVAYVINTPNITSVRVRIQIERPSFVSGTPIVRSYQLAAKVRRS